MGVWRESGLLRLHFWSTGEVHQRHQEMVQVIASTAGSSPNLTFNDAYKLGRPLEVVSKAELDRQNIHTEC